MGSNLRDGYMYDVLHVHKRISLMKVLAPIIVKGPVELLCDYSVGSVVIGLECSLPIQRR